MAVSYIGTSAVTTTIANQTITPHASTATGDLLLFFHYTNADTGTEAVTSPGSWTDIFNTVTTNFGLLCVSWHIRAGGETTYSSTIANHLTGTSGDSMLEWIETYRGIDPTTPIGEFTASLSTWASPLDIGSIAAPASASLAVDDMVVVVGGRRENVTAQTTLTGHSLTWGQGPTGTTNTGRDAGSASQHGLNASGSAQTITAKTITTTGTAQAGAGRMFFINATAPQVDVDGSLAVTVTLSATAALDLPASGNLAVTATETGTAALDLPASGNIAVTAALTGDATVTGGGANVDVDGTLAVTTGLTATAQAEYAAVGDLAVTTTLSGTAVPEHTVDGSLPVTVGLSGTAATAVAVDGPLAVTVGLTGTAATTVAVAGNSPIAVTLAGTAEVPVAGQVDVDGSLAVTALAAGLAALSLPMAGNLALTATLTGDAVIPPPGSVVAIDGSLSILVTFTSQPPYGPRPVFVSRTGRMSVSSTAPRRST